MPPSRGRVVAIEDDALLLHGEPGLARVALTAPSDARPGDLVVVEEGRAVVVTRGRGADPGARQRRTLDPRRLRAMEIRARVEDGIRGFFRGRGFREVHTNVMVPSPGMEPHIKPFRAGDGAFLHTSPEFAMKRLLAGGLERIFQMAPVFRDEPDAPAHRREFTMLEWYRAWAGLEDIAVDTEELVARLATAIHGRPAIPHPGGEIDVSLPWPRLTVRALFAEHAGVDLGRDDLAAACARHGLHVDAADGWDELLLRLWLARVEPALPAGRAVLVTRYPASQAALAVIDADPDGTRWARRFEVYAGGHELANAFEELTDPDEQRRRFTADVALRARAHPDWPASPMPEDFLAALEDGMPPSGGIALGVDRLVMLLAGEPDIAWVNWP
jgi:lysyl-tRNA synthetase class 2